MSIVPTFGSRTMELGSTGSDVRELQTKLNSLNFKCGSVTGVFNTDTLTAVKSLQQTYKIAVDGKVTEAVCKLINALIESGKPTASDSSQTITIMTGETPTVKSDELLIAIQSKTGTSETRGTTSIITNKIYYPPIEGEVTWDTERSGSPSKVRFNVLGQIEFTEGDIVQITYGSYKVFLGYIFELSTDKTGITTVTAYDQLRYFKNEDSYTFSNKKASQILHQIANDYRMSIGSIEDTSVVINSLVADNQSLFDIVGTALDKTLVNSDKLFVLYDDFGKICLKSLDSMRVNLLLCEDTVQDYSFSSSIDSDTYNQIVIYYDNKETSKREYFTAVDDKNMSQWGILRKTESVDTTNGAQSLANLNLAIYNKKVRKLSINGAFGRPDVRAGTLIPVIMTVGDVNLKNFMLVEKASHKWSNGTYVMDLDLSGAGEFSV